MKCILLFDNRWIEPKYDKVLEISGGEVTARNWE